MPKLYTICRYYQIASCHDGWTFFLLLLVLCLVLFVFVFVFFFFIFKNFFLMVVGVGGVYLFIFPRG